MNGNGVKSYGKAVGYMPRLLAVVRFLTRNNIGQVCWNCKFVCPWEGAWQARSARGEILPFLIVKKIENGIIDSLMKRHAFSHWRSRIAGTLDGRILIAHPFLDEEQFAKTILFVESDDEHNVIGIILNRPLHIMLKALGENFENLPISNVPVYYGGRDGETTVVLTAWVFDEEREVFEIYYTLNGDEAMELMKTRENIQFRAFLGFCSFDQKVYDDIERGLWIIGDAKNLFGAQEHTETLWQSMLLKESPDALIESL
ncbi:MAG: YqgE/AlgH family protein [Puniceicoccales bacterium]|nr:YqgE/AlgH family protein [Puniceicoccales bacterium]